MNRLDKYCNLLEDIYGNRIVELFTMKNENYCTLTMNNVADNQKAKKNYDRKDGEGCKICKADNKINFFKRNLEFPGWIGDLNFTGTSPAKEIMIIGEDPPKLKDQINIAFGLGLYPIDSNGDLNFDSLKETYSGDETQVKAIISQQRNKNKLWKYLNLLFLNKLSVIKPKVYITDLCKCNDETKDKEMWTRCLSICLIKEIELINPNLIIFQGWNSYKYLMNYLYDEGLRGKLDFSKNLYDDPYYGMLSFNQKEIHSFTIVHQASFFRYKKKEEKGSEYITRMQKFIETQIFQDILK